MRQTIKLENELAEAGKMADAANQPKSTKKILVQIEVTPEERNSIKSFFSAHGVTVKAGLVSSFNFVKSEIDAGRAAINAGGVYKL